MSNLSDFEAINRGYIAFGGNPKSGKITGKGKIRTSKLDFDDVYFVKELKFNIFSVLQMCDKKNSVLFTDTECVILSPDFKLPDDNHVLLRVPRENNMYNVDLKNIIPSGDLTCLFVKATLDESNLWHRRLGHINFKTINKLVKNPQNTDDDATFEVKEPEFEGHTQEEGIDYEEDFAPVARIEAIRLFLAYASFMGFMVYQIDVKSAFLYGTIKEEVYVYQPPRFEDPDYPDKFYKVDTLTKSMNYQPVTVGNQPNPSADPQNTDDDATFEVKEPEFEEDVGAEAGFTNFETTITVSPIPTTRVHKDHHVTQIIGDLSLATQTRSMTRMVKHQGGLTQITNKDFHTCMFACFLSQEEPKREEGIDYEEDFAPVVRIEAIRLFLAYDSFMGFMVYQIDVKSAFLYGTIKEEVYVCQPPRFEDPDYPDKFYKVVKALYGLHQAPRVCQDKYVAKILRKFGLTDGKSASTSIDTEKPLLKDPDGEACGGCQFLGCRLISWQCKKKTVVAASSTEA
nr:ribonuclease H-like domain-containing protein [Tanacetum cinerariifolium]